MEPSSAPAPRYFVRIAPRLPLILCGVITLLLTVHLGLAVYNFHVHEVDPFVRDLFDVDQENNIPTWYSNSTLLLTCGLLLAIASAKRRERDRDAGRWLGLSVIFGFLALDEDAGLHETLNNYLSGFQVHWLTWVVPALGLLVVFAFFYLRFWWRLPPRTRWLFAASGIIYVVGAVGVEYFSSQFVDNMETLAYSVQTALEEGMEMYGIALFIYTLLSYMRGTERSSVPVGVEPAP